MTGTHFVMNQGYTYYLWSMAVKTPKVQRKVALPLPIFFLTIYLQMISLHIELALAHISTSLGVYNHWHIRWPGPWESPV